MRLKAAFSTSSAAGTLLLVKHRTRRLRRRFGRRAFDKFFWQSSPAGVSQLEGSAQVFWQSSPAGVSPGLLALDLACANSYAPHPRRSLSDLMERRKRAS